MNIKINKLINEKQLKERIRKLANTISNDYNNEDIVLVCILKGAIYFATDLSRMIKNNNVIIDFIKVSSYGNKTESTGKIKFQLDLSTNIENKNVIVVEDIIDSGITLNYLCDYLKTKNPKTLKLCVLLDKPERRKQPINVDYVGFEVEDKFIIGYGMDYNDEYRTLPYIGYLDN